MSFDALTGSDDDCARFVERLISETVQSLGMARTDEEEQIAIASYVRQACDANLSPSEVVDFFCVSGDCVLDRVGYSEEKASDLTARFDKLHEDYRRIA